MGTRLVVILAFFSSLVLAEEVSPPISPLAADAVSAKYRTGKIDERVANRPEAFRSFSSSSSSSSSNEASPEVLKKLAAWLTAETTDDFLKVKRLHDWITDCVAYDVDKFQGRAAGSSDPVQVARTFRATCGGYAALFQTLAKSAGLEVVTIQGISRNAVRTDSKEMFDHAWNAVRIASKWYLVDTTHDNRAAYRNGAFSEKSAYRDTQLFISPVAKVNENLPLEPRYQFLAEPMSREDFLNRPYTTMKWIHYGLRFSEDPLRLLKRVVLADPGEKTGVLTERATPKNEVLIFKIRAPDNVATYFKIRDANGKAFDTHAFSWVSGPEHFIALSSPGPGIYTAIVSARFTQPLEPLAAPVYSFQVEGSPEPGPLLPVPGDLYLLDVASVYGVKIVSHNLSGTQNSESLTIEIEHSQGTSVFAGIYEDGVEAVKVRGQANMLPSTKAGAARTRFTIPRQTAATYLLKIKAKPTGQSLFNDTVAVARIGK